MQDSVHIKDDLKKFTGEILNSYSQIFFSDSRVFALLLLLVSFADLYAGFAGLISVVVTSVTGRILGLDRNTMSKGIYGFNSLLVGLSLGIYFSPGPVLFILVILSSILTMFISVSLHGVIGKYGLPFLSIPFVLSAWIMTLATRNMTFLSISERGIYTFNDLYTLGGQSFVKLYEWWNGIGIIRPLKIYFISLGAILFQYNVLAGILVAAGLLYFSRIAFTLSLAGFFAAYFFYDFTGADLTENNYSYIGFNYILTSIAVGGYFIIPSVRSYLWSLLLIPVVALISISLYSFFLSASLPIYALPFNIVTLLFLYVLKFRVKSHGLTEVAVQQNSPEKNLYSFDNYTSRFRHDIIPMRLPFYGTWTISQGYNGSFTHKGSWKHALDFVITGNDGKQFKGKGDVADDYFCYNKPVLAPADGFIETVIDGIDDNIIGKPNISDNWGNTVIIRHADYVFSSLNHLKKGSVTVRPGERIKAGSIIGRCGNSGRSPYPHLHFQVQSSSHTGSQTLSYPVGYYMELVNDKAELRTYRIPEEGNKISNIQTSELLVKAFDFIPGKTICFDAVIEGKNEKFRWEAGTTEFNVPFIRCFSSGAVAYFRNDGNMFIFTHYEGKRNTLLYYFFLSAFRVPLGYYRNSVITDTLPLNLVISKNLLWMQDFAAPFVKFIKTVYRLKYDYTDNEFMPSHIRLSSETVKLFAGKSSEVYKFAVEVDERGISGLNISVKESIISAAACQES
jgi:urea transporter